MTEQQRNGILYHIEIIVQRWWEIEPEIQRKSQRIFVGGSSSFDMAPAPYNKYYALDKYCAERGILHSEVIFVGDDYGTGGNDESVYQSDFGFIKVDNYLDFPKCVSHLL